LSRHAADSPAAIGEVSIVELDRLVHGVVAGDRRAAARLMSHIESDVDALGVADEAIYSMVGNARVVGVTGPPGSGKSTLVGRIVSEYRARKLSVAVLAVDPSSPDGGGALLGDRLRMGQHAGDDGVFIRSMAARDLLGGLAIAAPPVIRVMDALGFDRIIVETVGVGQSEFAVRDVADCVVLVSAPGAGDALQAMKSGIIEVGDIHVVNKADREGAVHVMRDIQAAVARRGKRRSVLLSQADSGAGVRELVDSLEHYLSSAAMDGSHRERRLRSLQKETLTLLERRAVQHIQLGFGDRFQAEMTEGLLEGRSPSDLAAHLATQLGLTGRP